MLRLKEQEVIDAIDERLRSKTGIRFNVNRQFGVRVGLFPWTVGFVSLALIMAQFMKDLIGKENVNKQSLRKNDGGGFWA